MSDINALRTVVDSATDLYKLGKDVATKQSTLQDIADGEKVLLDLSKLDIPTVLADAKALDASGEADLVAYVASKFTAATPKAQKILAASLKLAAAAYELEQAIAS